MTKGEKLRQFLESLGPGAKAELGRTLISRFKRSAGGQLPGKWMKDIGFNEANQAVVIEIYGLPPNFFDDATQVGEADGGSGGVVSSNVRYDSLRRFLADPPEQLSADERFWLCSQQFDPRVGDIGTSDWWYSEVKSYRYQRRLLADSERRLNPARAIRRGRRPVSRA